MTALGVLAITFVVLALVGYVSRRRFGVLGLALASGSLLSTMWSTQLVEIIEGVNVNVATLSTAGLASAVLVIAPALLLLFSGPVYAAPRDRFIGALLFGLFATLLISQPLGSALVMDELARSVYGMIEQYMPYIVTGGIVVALIDVLAIHTSGIHFGKRNKH